MALAVPLSRFTSRVGGGSAFFVRRHSHLMKITVITGVMAATILIAGCGKKPSSSSATPQVAMTNPVVVLIPPEYSSSGSPRGIVTSTNFDGKADLESLTNAVRAATSEPIINLRKEGNDGTRYLVSTDSAKDQREYTLTWSGTNWQVSLMSFVKH